jgi:hypothetical protein
MIHEAISFMKCPHCQVAIHKSLSSTQIVDEPVVKMSRPPHTVLAPRRIWQAAHQRCPECHGSIVFLIETIVQDVGVQGSSEEIAVYPRPRARHVPAEVPDPYRRDFTESSLVLADSEKASAALSRRCLQTLLRDMAGVKHADLSNEIDEFIRGGKAPSDVEEGLHAVRNIGNFAAHPIKSKSTGTILDVKPGEAERNLDVLERLFDYFFVGPAITARRKAELNKKLAEAGKPLIP